MKSRKRILLLTAMSVLFLNSCSDKIVEKPFISPPFAGINIDYTEFVVHAEKGDTLLFNSGSRIIIPPDIWIDSANNKISGEINIKYREFKNASDIFLSGIPLAYDSAGVKETLVTAGMFEIRAFKDSTELFIDKNKSLTVQLASNVTDTDYNFYYLDENNKNWVYKGTEQATANPKIQEIEDSIRFLQPKRAFPFDKSYFALNYDAVLDIYFKDNDNVIWKNRKSKLPKRKAEKYGLSWSGINCWQYLKYHGSSYEAYQMVWQMVGGKKLPRWAKDCYADKLTHIGNNIYNMHLTAKDKKTSIRIKAIMPLKHLFAYSAEKWQQDYDEIMEKIKIEEERLAMQFAVYRTFEVTTPGLHNWDRVLKLPSRIMVKGDFKFDKEMNENLASVDIYYFIEDNKSFVKISFSSTDSLMLVPDSTAKFVAVLSNNEAAFFSSAEYNKIDFNQLKANPAYTFNMKTKKINSKDDFLSLVGLN